MPLTIDLTAKEARLLRLAVFRMLGDPRWQSDRAGETGRRELVDVYEQTSATPADGMALRVEAPAVDLLESALRRLISELKNYELLSSAGGQRGASMVEGFDAEFARLFPEAASDRSELDRLLPELLALRRDFSRARQGLAEIAESREAERATERPPRWQFWRR